MGTPATEPRARPRRTSRRLRFCASLVCVVAVGAVGGNANVATAQEKPTDRGPDNSDEFERFLDGFMAPEMERLDIPGAAVVLVRDGETLSSTGYGLADRDDQVRVDPATTVFGIGSVSKPLTAVAALQQVERGSVALDTNINDVLDISVPDYRGSEVTLGSLLTHTSGFEERLIGYWTQDADEVGSLAEFEAGHIPSRFAATGEVHSYSNHNYGFAGLVVERASGQDFVTYMDDNVFDRNSIFMSPEGDRSIAQPSVDGLPGRGPSRRTIDQPRRRS